MMQKALLLTMTSVLIAGPAWAANENDHSDHAQEAGAMAPGMMMGMMNHEQMMQMHEHMQEIQQLMADIQVESDPERRMAMMEEHLVQMNEAMEMMGGTMMGKTGNANMAEMDMSERMQMMQNQMGMMGMMMQQMMEHLSTGQAEHQE